MKILLIGAGGQLASDLQSALVGEQITPVTHAQLDICESTAVQAIIESSRPEVIINTAAFHRVDDCEEQAVKAFSVNAGGVANVSRAAARAGALLVQFSTDQVFGGTQQTPYQEYDAANPVSIYGMSRRAGEQAAEYLCPRLLLVRTCGLYGRAGRRSKRGNFVESMLRQARNGQVIRVVNDQRCTPTSTSELAGLLAKMIRERQTGRFHITNAGDCTWFEFAQEIFRLAGLTPNLQAVSSQEFGARAPRPKYSVLSNTALHRAGYSLLRPWQEALAEYLKETCVKSAYRP
jgi:dTDP-4-dehydrorhamnose reductase